MSPRVICPNRVRWQTHRSTQKLDETANVLYWCCLAQVVQTQDDNPLISMSTTQIMTERPQITAYTTGCLFQVRQYMVQLPSQSIKNGTTMANNYQKWHLWHAKTTVLLLLTTFLQNHSTPLGRDKLIINTILFF